MQPFRKIRRLSPLFAFFCLASRAREEGGIAVGDDASPMAIEEAGSEEVEPSEFAGAEAEAAPVVEGLNQITRNKDYSHWLLCLDPSYRKLLSCSSYLEQVSGKLPKALKERSVRLASIEDYFEHVFVPARKNARVDSIQFASPERAYAIMDLPENGQAAVYILQREEGGSWKLASKNYKN